MSNTLTVAAAIFVAVPIAACGGGQSEPLPDVGAAQRCIEDRGDPLGLTTSDDNLDIIAADRRAFNVATQSGIEGFTDSPRNEVATVIVDEDAGEVQEQYEASERVLGDVIKAFGGEEIDFDRDGPVLIVWTAERSDDVEGVVNECLKGE